MSIDFTRISTGDDFELLCRDVLKSKGVNILSNPSVGPDQGKDILVEVESKDELGRQEKLKYVVQCKHYAKSGKSVQENDIGDFRSICDKHNANGYFLIASTIPSTNLSSSFEGVNAKGDYKCLIWDKKDLEIEIEDLDDSIDVIKRYNLKSDFDNISSFVNHILTSEFKLPFEFSHNNTEDTIGGKIYKKLLSDMPTLTYQSIGYFWTDHIVDSVEFDNIKSKHSLSELYIVATDNNQSDFSISINEFYMHIQEYKDYWYQSTIAKLFSFSATNPTAIRILETAVKKLPYKVQQPIEDILRNILEFDPKTTKSYDSLLVMEACQTIASLNIQTLKANVFEVLTFIPMLKEKFKGDKTSLIYLSTMTERVISSLVKLEEGKVEYKEEIKELFDSVDDLDYKMAILPYFKKFDIQDFDDELNIIKKNDGSYPLNPQYHGTLYSESVVVLMENEAKYTVSRVIDDYFGIKENDYGPIISYTSFKVIQKEK